MTSIDKEIKVKEYINNYLSELQRHFDISDKKMRVLLYKIYKETSTLSKIKLLVKKYISMIKSFYKIKIKKDI